MATTDKTTALDVQFALGIGPTGMLNEADPALATYEPQLWMDDLTGQIIIALADGQAPLIITDDLIGLVWALCLNSIEPLREGREHVAKFIEDPGSLLLLPRGELTELVRDGESVGTVSSQALAEGFLACVQRLASTMGRLGRGDEEVRIVADTLIDRVSELRGA